MGFTVSHSIDDDRLTVFLEGRIDSANSAEAEEQINAAILSAGAEEIIIDADRLSYISSAGLRILMRIKKRHSELSEIINVSQQVFDILEVTGFTELFTVSKKMREVSVEGCEIVGKGFFGTVYRIDNETIVKAYRSKDSLDMIRNEKALAKIALISGVPTAISYDIVKVGDGYGSVFELLNSKTFNDLLISQPENSEAIIKQYAEFLRTVNSKEVPEGRLVSSKKRFLEYLVTISKYITPEESERIRELIEAVPDRNFVIHGDAQMKNIMQSDSGPILIDMDTLTAGDPIFDLQSLYVTYSAFDEDDPTNSVEFLGIPRELTRHIWDVAVGYYFGTDDEERIAALKDKIALVGSIRFMFLIDRDSDHSNELFRRRIATTRKHISELLEKVKDLDIGL